MLQSLYFIAAVLVIGGSVAQIIQYEYAAYIFTAGTALLIFLHGKDVADSWKAELQKQRLARIGLFTSLMLGLAVYFMFTNSNSWVVFVLIYALNTLYQSFRNK